MLLPPQAGHPCLTLLSRTSANEREKQKSRYYIVSEDTTCSKHTNTMARMSFLERWEKPYSSEGEGQGQQGGGEQREEAWKRLGRAGGRNKLCLPLPAVQRHQRPDALQGLFLKLPNK